MLQAKLCMPYIGRNIVKRKKIAEKLRLLPDYKLALLSAPAGYGKTTAVVDYLTGENLKLAWLSIDKADNDPLRFWQYLLAAVSQCTGNDEINRTSLDADLVASNITVDLLISAIETLSQKFVVVLDDYHLIDNSIVVN
ncbi:MAG TPA: helix-turn-helix transcriptional regulator, partial [Firmicutes bacterium]|nr:helix-turn-helix transcriptional regulator [Bacillota bacterium]